MTLLSGLQCSTAASGAVAWSPQIASASPTRCYPPRATVRMHGGGFDRGDRETSSSVVWGLFVKPAKGGDAAHWFDRLLQRLEEGLLVPFLGAGISKTAAPHRNAKAPSGYKPDVGWLNAQLIEMLMPGLSKDEVRERLAEAVFVDALLQWQLSQGDAARVPDGHPRKQPASNTEALGAMAGQAKRQLGKVGAIEAREKAIEPLAKAARNRLDHLAEAAIWEFGAETVCRRLRIELFAALEPTAAHVYLAYLAREGLVSEIFTTNYDTCIEKAFERTFHPDERRGGQRQRYSVDPPPAPEAEGPELQVIGRLEQYRQRGGRCRTREGAGKARPTLRLFKLNGCAFEYRQVRRCAKDLPRSRSDRPTQVGQALRDAAGRIILTERQLQSFRKETWARDLFQDRARCQGLLFSGFGSEEPQIRHTALALMREWGNTGNQRCWDRPNAPFMTVFEEQLSFTQYQLMHGYRDAHDCGRCEGREDLACRKHRLQHCFTGRDGRWFGQSDIHRRLPADLFWRRVFQAAFLRRARRLCEQPGPFTHWVTSSLGRRAPRRELQGFANWIHPAGAGVREGQDRRSGDRDPWDTRFALLDEDPAQGTARDQPRPPLRLSRWLMAVQGSQTRWERSSLASHPYFPLREDPLLPMGVLFMVYELMGSHRLAEAEPLKGAGVPEPTALGLRVPVRVAAVNGLESPARETKEGWSVHLISNDWSECNELADDRQAVFQVVIPSLERLPSGSRMQRPASPASRCQLGRVWRLSAERLLEARDRGLVGLLRAFAAEAPRPPRARLIPLQNRSQAAGGQP